MRRVREVTMLLLATAAGTLAPVACKRSKPQVVIYTSVDQVFSEPVLREFERQTGVAVRSVYDTEETKSTGVLNRLIAEANSPRADVFWANDPIRPILLVRRGMVTRYVSANAAAIPTAFKAADGTWTDFAARVRVLLVSKQRVPAGEAPTSIQAYVASRWTGQAAIANPVFGTTTMHVAALFTVWGDDRARAFMNAMKANGVRVASSNGEVKRLVASGEAAFGLVDNDDAISAVQENAPVDVVYPDQDDLGALLVPTSAVLMRGGPNAENGRKLIDYLVSSAVERQMAERAAHIPLRPDLPTPAGVPTLGKLRFMNVDYATVGEAMERIQPYLREWAGL